MKSYQQRALEQDLNISSQLLSMLAYMGCLCLAPLLINRTDDYVSFHTRQGLVIWVIEVLAGLILFTPTFGRFFFSAAISICILFSIFGVISVFLEKAWLFPFFGALAQKL
ncbi:MAG TPA: hypothetical protein ENI77_08120 [Nitrospirae bacterium]|mgnify:CR=1 FL=1|nr:hypothetical protein [Nitrospirota bacterium]